MTARLAAVAGAALLLAVGLAGCAAEEPADTTSPSHFTPSASPGDDPSATPTADPVDLPTDCREILSDDVLAQLSDVPLNDPAFGESGAQDDGSLVCVWGDPGADTTNLSTTIERMSRGPALELLNELMDEEDYSCWDADGGTRCEKTWENETYPVTDGRTLFWRQDVLIDTSYSNLAPEGYTSSIVAALFD